jgi:thiamine pyrophosphokinase
MNALVLAGGIWPSDDRVLALAKESGDVICCDGAAKNTVRLGIIPQLLLGDMDSITEEDRTHLLNQGVRESRLPAAKDETDGEAACKLAIAEGASRTVILGGLGGRFDHSLGNIHCLWMLHNEGIEAWIESGDELAHIVTSSHKLGKYAGCTFSLIPLLPQTEVFRMIGVKYPLMHTPLMLGSTLGISNAVLQEDAQITMQSGTALLLINLGGNNHR